MENLALSCKLCKLLHHSARYCGRRFGWFVNYSAAFISTWKLHLLSIGISAVAFATLLAGVSVLIIRLNTMKTRMECQMTQFRQNANEIWSDITDLRRKIIPQLKSKDATQYPDVVLYPRDYDTSSDTVDTNYYNLDREMGRIRLGDDTFRNSGHRIERSSEDDNYRPVRPTSSSYRSQVGYIPESSAYRGHGGYSGPKISSSYGSTSSGRYGSIQDPHASSYGKPSSGYGHPQPPSLPYPYTSSQCPPGYPGPMGRPGYDGIYVQCGPKD